MRAAQFTSYNGPQALHLGDIPVPNITARQVLVRVAGSSVNQMDVLEQEGKMKLFTGRSFPIGTGVDFAGTISAVGAHVSGYKVGDRVWGYVGFRRPGTSLAAADYIAVSPHCLSPAPTTIPLVEAAALPLAGLAALKGFAGLKAGEKVLVIGGNGGVGSTAIQVALALGAEVDAVTGTEESVAKHVGAGQTFNYHITPPSSIPGRYSFILDTAGINLLPYRALLAPGGRFTTVAPAVMDVLRSLVTRGPRIRIVSAGANPTGLAWLAQKVDSGEIRPVIGGIYPAEQVRDAYRAYSAAESAHGKLVISWED